MSELIYWLLEGPSWIQYRTRLDLMNQSEKDPEVLNARKEILIDSKIKELIEELNNWPGPALKGHKAPSHPIHKLVFLSDLGLSKSDPQINILEVLGKECGLGCFAMLP